MYAHLAGRPGVRMLFVHYRLAPEFVWTAPIEDFRTREVVQA
jgi:acetyl esterase/lipase